VTSFVRNTLKQQGFHITYRNHLSHNIIADIAYLLLTDRAIVNAISSNQGPHAPV
jgi:hypothetical protein